MRLSEFKQRYRNNSLVYLINHYAKRSLQTIRFYLEELRWRHKWKVTRPLGEVEVREIVRARRRGCYSKPRGRLNIVYVGYGDRVCVGDGAGVLDKYAERNILLALKRFGEVREFMVEYPGDCRSPLWSEKRVEIGRNLVGLIEGMPQTPDLLMGQMSGWLVDRSALEQLRLRGVLVINYSWDDTAGFYGTTINGAWSGPAALASSGDLNLTSSRKSCLKYQAEGGLAVFWPEAANSDIHRPHDLPFEFEVSFVGGRYGYRPLLIEFLRKHGVEVATFGPGWEGGMLTGEEMVKLYSQSRINLGFGGIGHMVKIQHLKGRDFEVPMSGGLYLTSYNSELEECYEIGKEIVCYRDKRDCVEKIRYLLERPVEAEAIRKAGRERALRDHTWERRLEQIFRLVGLLE